MYKSMLVSVAALASTAYANLGQAVVINGCNYDVHLSAVPAQYGGYSETDHVLSPKGTFSQTWTQLSNGAGWSIKLAKNPGDTSIMQYEYTFQNDGTIWYDLSCVDGNPWDKNWEITSAGDATCSPRNAAYRYSTDDAYGMQSCNQAASLTVTLCSGESQNDVLVSSIAAVQSAGATLTLESKAAAAPTTTSTTTPAPVVATTPTTTTTPVAAATTTNGHGIFYDGNHFYNAAVAVHDSTTTLTTATSTPMNVVAAQAADDDDDVVTVWQTVVETAIAYQTYTPGKRHVHHPDHPNFR